MKSQTFTKITKFRPQIRSRHPSHDHLRKSLNLVNKRVVLRFGSTTELEDGKQRVEINTIEAIRNSSDKLRMKKCFTDAKIKSAQWWTSYDGTNFNGDEKLTISELPYPIVSKHRFGSKGRGNTLIKSEQELQNWLKGKNLTNYIFEKYYNYVREYRIHVSNLGCFYSCRKMIKSDTPEDKRWYKNDDNCVWITESNELFDKPSNWNLVLDEATKALNAVGLNIGAIDLRIQSAKDQKGISRTNPEFIIIEINSAPGLGDLGKEIYKNHINELIQHSINETNS